MSERSGIEIDYCPQCRGVWLDRGELDKILERAAAEAAAYAEPPVPQHAAAHAPLAPPQSAPPAPQTPPIPQTPPQMRPAPPAASPPAAPYGSGGDLRRDRGYEEQHCEDRPYEDRRYDDYDGGYRQPGYDPRRRKQRRPMDWLGELFD